MSTYEEAKNELKSLISELKSTGGSFDSIFAKLKAEEEKITKLRDSVAQLAKERQIGFPWLAKAYDDFFVL